MTKGGSKVKRVYSFLGDFYHSHDVVYQVLNTACEQLGVELIDTGINDIGTALEAAPDAIVMYLENRVNPESESGFNWLTDELDSKITGYVKDGGSFFAIHAGLSSYPPESGYIKMLGGHFVSHPKDNCRVKFTSEQNLPIEDMQGFDFEVVCDEHYFVKVDEARTTVFLRSSSEHGESVGGWYHSYGKGRVICITPTHTVEGFEHPEVLRLFQSSLEWSLDGHKGKG